MSSSSGIQKVLEKTSQSIQDGNFYEAHQMIHSVSQRYIKQKKNDTAIHLISSGIKNMLIHEQFGSSLDLVERLIDVFETALTPYDTAKAHLVDVFDYIPLSSNIADQFIKRAIKYSTKPVASEFGDSNLHHVFGMRHLKEQSYYEAEFHFVYGTMDSAHALGAMCFELSQQHYHSDPAYFITRGVLQYLALDRMEFAKASLERFLSSFSASNTSIRSVKLGSQTVYLFENSNLINFIQSLVVSVERRSLEAFNALQTRFQSDLNFDSFLGEVLTQVGIVFFDNGPKKPINPMAEMFKSLLMDPSSSPSAPGRLPSSIEMD